ncbi:MAG: hypothetical protein GF372_00215 [Candidatus Marinimicrobia bacterium]|nr:hypothetical protein [Candidatus Neomarinimicrobiota bacterium]
MLLKKKRAFAADRETAKSQAKMIKLFCLLLMIAAAGFAKPKTIKIKPLGNSITASWGGRASYRYYLWRYLVDEGYASDNPSVDQGVVDFTGVLCGTGDNGQIPDCNDPLYPESEWDWDHAGYNDIPIPLYYQFCLPPELDHDTADIALIHMGTNDLLYKNNLDSSKVYLHRIIEKLRRRNPRVVILLCKIIPVKDYYIAPWNQDSVISWNDRVYCLACDENQAQSPIYLVDQYTGYQLDWNQDGIHPNDEGELFIAQRFRDVLVPVLDSMISAGTEITITSPRNWNGFQRAEALRIDATGYAYGINNIEFFKGSTSLGQAWKLNDSSYYLNTRIYNAGLCTLTAVITDSLANTKSSSSVIIGVRDTNYIYQSSINNLQGQGNISKEIGTKVKTSGYVAKFSEDETGFWIQTPVNSYESSGLLVSDVVYNSANQKPAVGDLVEVTGIIHETGTLPSEPLTLMSSVSQISVISSGHDLPILVDLDLIPTCAGCFFGVKKGYEQKENMLVRMRNSRVVCPTNSEKQFAVTPYYNSICVDPPDYENVWTVRKLASETEPNFHPHIVLIDGSNLEPSFSVRTGDVIQNLVGVFSYSNGMPVIQPIADSLRYTHNASIPSSPIGSRWSDIGFWITTFNLGGLFDTVDAPQKDDSVCTAAEYEIRIQKLVLAITEELLNPPILCLQGVENIGILNDLAERVNALSSCAYRAVSYESSDPQGLENGILWDATKIENLLDSYLMDGPDIEAAFGVQSGNPGREPLVCHFRQEIDFYIVNIDLIDQSSDDPLFGVNRPRKRPSEELRRKQALAVRSWINDRFALNQDAHILIAGNINDYTFNESGELDSDNPHKIIKGNSLIKEKQLYDLNDYIYYNGHPSKFTEISNGRGKYLSSIFFTQWFYDWAIGASILHFNAGFEAALTSDNTTAIRCSDYDPIEIQFSKAKQ